MPIIITSMRPDDIAAVAKIHAQQFPRQHSSTIWVECNFAAFPRVMMFVARNEAKNIIAYIQWLQKSGFRKQTIIELEQLAVLENYQGKGIGTRLIKESLHYIKTYLANNGANLKAILVSTRTDNSVAKILYKKVLGAEEVAIIKDLYSYDEIIMLARDT